MVRRGYKIKWPRVGMTKVAQGRDDQKWPKSRPYILLPRISMFFKSSFGASKDAGGFVLGFWILILIWLWLLGFDTCIIQILALHLDFEGAKDIDVL